MAEKVKTARENAIDMLFEFINSQKANKYNFKHLNNRIKVNIKTTKYSAEDLIINTVFIDENGWLRINGLTNEYVFAEITVFSDALSTEDLVHLFGALVKDSK